jgi:IS30 family transposase
MNKVDQKSVEAVEAARRELLCPYKERALTIMGNRGKEFTHHQLVTKELDRDYYFSHLY